MDDKRTLWTRASYVVGAVPAAILIVLVVIAVEHDWSADAWAALGTWATAAVAVVAGMVALAQLGEARRLRAAQAREARQFEMSRPALQPRRPTPGAETDPYWRLVAAFLVGYPPHSSRAYFGDLKAWYAWCASSGVHPLAARRHHVGTCGDAVAHRTAAASAQLASGAPAGGDAGRRRRRRPSVPGCSTGDGRR
jgi:uncharacterized membrane protein